MAMLSILPQAAKAAAMPALTEESSAAVSHTRWPFSCLAPLGKRYTSCVTILPPSALPTMCLPELAPMSMARYCFISFPPCMFVPLL